MWVKINHHVVATDSIAHVDFTEVEHLRAKVHLKDGTVLQSEHIDTIELAMALKPSVLESRRLRWARHAWSVHNIIGHPLMQVLAWFKCYKKAMHVHDATVPRPKGMR